MGILFITALAVALFALLVVGASKADNATVKQLERNGRLCLGTVLSYDGDDLAEVEFIPTGAAASIKTLGLGHFHKKQFPPGSKVAVWYNPLCPSVNRVVPERTNDAYQQS
jgi:hypothetical protein